MDSSTRTAHLRNLAVYVNYRERASYKTNSVANNQILNERTLGAIDYTNHCDCDEDDPMYPCLSVQPIVLSALESLLQYSATANLGPTKTSRLLYLFFATTAYAYNWSQPGVITGTHDSLNWDIHTALSNEGMDVYLWMTRLLIYTMPLLVPGYNPAALQTIAQTLFGWDAAIFASNMAEVESKGNYAAWKAAWNTWFAYRQNDGNVAAAAWPQTPPVTLPNGTTYLNPATTQTFTNAGGYPNPSEWTPLVIGGVNKNYYTYGWGNVRSSCSQAFDETSIKSRATAFYPPTSAARQAEILTIANLGNMPDIQKIQAEFWAAGPNTVSPPGMLAWFWKNYVYMKNPMGTTATDSKMLYSGLDLAIQLFEIGRIVWELKSTYMQARPIQEVRNLFGTTSFTKYDGTPIMGNMWVPYQMPNFVTPPFPDFPSGHSAYSQCFANVMTAWFGANVPTTSPVTLTDLNLISHLFNYTTNQPFGVIQFNAGASEIQPTVVPSTTMYLSWPTWQEMADSAGMSRQYGGIHALSAHQASQAAANSLSPKIHADWGITPF